MAELLKALLPLNLQMFADEPGDGAQDSDPADNPEDEKGTGNDKPEDKKEVKTFTQEQLNAIAAKESKSATEKVLKDLGITDFENAKDGMEKFREWQEAQKTEEDKRNEKLTSLETASQEKDKNIQSLQYENAALKADVNPDYIDDVVALAEKRVTDDVDINAAIKVVMEQYPHFGKVQKEQDGETPPPHFLGGQHKGKSDKELDPFAAKVAKYQN